MALTNAERQARYRQRHLRDADTADMRILRLTLDVTTRNKLTRVASHRGCSVTALVARWADEAEKRILARATPAEERKYFAATDLKIKWRRYES